MAETENTTIANDKMKLVGALNHLIETNINAEKGYATAAADVRDPDAKKLLMRRAEQRAAFVEEIQSTIVVLGSVPENEGTALGSAHRAWMGLRKAIEGRSDAGILEECLMAEESARQSYAKAMNDLALAGWGAELRRLVEDQYTALRIAQSDLQRALAVARS